MFMAAVRSKEVNDQRTRIRTSAEVNSDSKQVEDCQCRSHTSIENTRVTERIEEIEGSSICAFNHANGCDTLVVVGEDKRPCLVVVKVFLWDIVAVVIVLEVFTVVVPFFPKLLQL